MKYICPVTVTFKFHMEKKSLFDRIVCMNSKTQSHSTDVNSSLAVNIHPENKGRANDLAGFEMTAL